MNFNAFKGVEIKLKYIFPYKNIILKNPIPWTCHRMKTIVFMNRQYSVNIGTSKKMYILLIINLLKLMAR